MMFLVPALKEFLSHRRDAGESWLRLKRSEGLQVGGNGITALCLNWYWEGQMRGKDV